MNFLKVFQFFFVIFNKGTNKFSKPRTQVNREKKFRKNTPLVLEIYKFEICNKFKESFLLFYNFCQNTRSLPVCLTFERTISLKLILFFSLTQKPHTLKMHTHAYTHNTGPYAHTQIQTSQFTNFPK